MTAELSIPTATYRLQLHKQFTFRDAEKVVPQLHDLGISHVYTSPIFKAAPGSVHGYDLCDHNQLNPELGSREDFDAFSAALRQRGMGLIVDFVPNHMGIADPSNGWWMDVLENGPSSPFANFFDIDWNPIKRELENKVLLPILGNQYGHVLESGELSVSFIEGAFFLNYFAARLPVSPRTARPLLQEALRAVVTTISPDHRLEFESILTAIEHLPTRFETTAEKIEERARERKIIKRRLVSLCAEAPPVEEAIQACVRGMNEPGDSKGYDALDELITNQCYRLSYWRVAGEEINYRRFFDINTLAAIRMELPDVFDAAHGLLSELLQSGDVTGVRLDHVDGLYDPCEYLTLLQARYAHLRGLPAGTEALYVLVEKILGPDEHLRQDWPVHGTTGYEFANQIVNLLVDQHAAKAFTETYSRFTEERTRFTQLVYESKLLVMRAAMSSEVNVLGHMLNRLSETNRWYRDFTLNALTAAVRETIACFPVYRSYLVPGASADEYDRGVIQRAIDGARRRNPTIDRSIFDFLREVLLPTPGNPHPVHEEDRIRFAMKFQQCTGPITAKGVEDTAFYIYNRLVALNEVGGEPGIFAAGVDAFHSQNAARQAGFPHCMLATSTHDTKRSEDVRARIAALSEMPQTWAQCVRRWHAANARHKQDVAGELAPDRNEEYLLYQTLLGSWPLEALDNAAHEEYIARVQQYMEKALREAKVNSSWIDPNQAWDVATRDFVAAILHKKKGAGFLRSFAPVAREIAELGAINSLSQTVLKLTSPGVPDFYQGNETWDFSLVDPDNRRPVDYAHRQTLFRSLDGPVNPAELLTGWKDGRIKLFLIRTILAFRRENPDLFQRGAYNAIDCGGEFASSLVAFTRTLGGKRLLVVAPRLTRRVGFPPVGECWHDSTVAAPGTWRNILTGAQVNGERLPAQEVLRELPVAVLVSSGS